MCPARIILSHRVVEYSLVLFNIMAAYAHGLDYVISRDMNIRLLLELLYTEVLLITLYCFAFNSYSYGNILLQIAGGYTTDAAYAWSS